MQEWEKSWLCRPLYSHEEQYLAMYSTWFKGVVTDPRWMLVPIDDHMVHRGDGVFEAFKNEGAKIYLLEAHIDRLLRSGELIGLELPFSRERLIQLILEVRDAAGPPPLLFRLYWSRGPGGFSVNPYESVGSQVYIVATRYRSPAPGLYQLGLRASTSRMLAKDSWFAQIKSCNYLPNVMMKKEAVDRGLDLTIAFDREGFLAEGATENVAIVTSDDRFLHPPFTTTLRGTTLLRLLELLGPLVGQGRLQGIGEAALTVEDVRRAKEMVVVGTTVDVLPIVNFDGHAIGSGQVGPIAKLAREILRRDIEG